MATDPLDEVVIVDGPSAFAQIDPYGVTRVDCWPIDLTVDGKPGKKGRPRFGNGRTFTDEATLQGEDNVRTAWIAAGKPRIDAPALEARIDAIYERPQAHYKKNGQLNAAGQTQPHPTSPRHGDLDNIAKLALDALNDLAYPDDRYVVVCTIAKRWVLPTSLGDGTVEIERAHTRIRIRPYQED